ncbi:basic amino acid ABC transporter substrate-binding protein [Chitinimonas sp. BJB300]|uniref:basic amino acid ABC transporter substrate-binding protein n=1 Tax=Chitinimonas sp. BJB300 TaxID=1559339 RepID=UPI000C0CA991|nr:basic amino acid ABC transporter substrate-binding protein [Chitinimonas sp. BJB300]PHV12614.1 basic amino acid ABC transporter substrate-binding protein [Chitinimonas sp. BJB300]TSJ89930.1 basic amino acid ABC transporter substrate-binding protein [Chitinimonas sp. BJB300]
MHTSRRLVMSAFAAALLLAACGKKDVPPANPAVPAMLTVKVAADAVFAPFESETQDKKVVGFDVDVLTAAAEQAGFHVDFVNTPWEGIFNTLTTGDRDIVASAVTITNERKTSMDFSEPYFEAKQLIAINDGTKVESATDLKNKKVGVQTGSTGDEVAQGLLGKTNANIKRFESVPLALQELQAGGVDAVIADNGVVAHYAANNPNAKIKTLESAGFSKEFYGFAVKKGNTVLLAKINQGLAKIKTDGTYDKIYTQYFGTQK